jgi:hypothetical protein
MTSDVVTREQVLTFRLQRHNLVRRLAAGSLEEAAAVCGIQNSPPGAALLALHARVEGVTGAALDQALLVDKRLVQLWSVRSAPLIVPASDTAAFTLGLLPHGEKELLFFIKGAKEHLSQLGMTAGELVAATSAALHEVLDNRELTKDELGIELSRRVAVHVPAGQLALWNSPDEWGHFGESLVRFALYVVALQDAFCVISHKAGPATFVHSDQWLGRPSAQPSPELAAVELLRRYLAAYGPSTVQHYAAWAGIAAVQAQRTWGQLAAELTGVKLAGKTLWVRSSDLPLLQASSLPEGVRLLPPHDPYLAARDRTLLVPDKTVHGQIWRAVGNPGIVLLHGEIVAMWRAQKKGTTLRVDVTGIYKRIDGANPLRTAVEEEMYAVARLRGCRQADVTYQ